MKQRPATVRALNSAQIYTDFRLQRRIDTIQKMFQQYVFGRDCGIGFELKYPVAVILLPPAQRRPTRPSIALVERRERNLVFTRRWATTRGFRVTDGLCRVWERKIASAAVTPLTELRPRWFRATAYPSNHRRQYQIPHLCLCTWAAFFLDSKDWRRSLHAAP